MVARAARQRGPRISINPFNSTKGSKVKQISTISLIIVALGAGNALAQQQMDDMKHMDMGKHKMGDMKGMDIGGQKGMHAQTHKAVGVVKKVDPQAGAVTFDHEPVKSLNWPAMTMTFGLKDKMLLDTLAAGRKVEFEFVKEGKGYTVTSVK